MTLPHWLGTSGVHQHCTVGQVAILQPMQAALQALATAAAQHPLESPVIRARHEPPPIRGERNTVDTPRVPPQCCHQGGPGLSPAAVQQLGGGLGRQGCCRCCRQGRER
jgi:hypothetical protein